MSESIPTPRVWLIDWYTPERFDAKVQYPEAPDGCWIWTGPTAGKGYGQTTTKGTRVYVHRLSYMAHVGPIPEGLEIDHLCRTPLCVRPDHLEPVTHAENVRRALPFRQSPTHCPQGHPHPEGGPIPAGCRECVRDWWKQNGAAVNQRLRERYANDPEYRTAFRAAKNQRARQRRSSDPEYRAKVNADARKRYEAKKIRQHEGDTSSS